MHLHTTAFGGNPYLTSYSSMTADIYVTGCYSETSGYTPTVACFKDAPETDYGDYTKTFTYDALMTTEYFNIPTGKTEPTVTVIRGLNEGFPGMIGFSAVPMATLVHHQSDLEAAKASTAVTTKPASPSSTVTTSPDSSGTDTGSESAAATTSSAARRLNPAGSA